MAVLPNLTSLTTIPFFITKIILPSTSSNFPFYIIILILMFSLSNILRFILSSTYIFIFIISFSIIVYCSLIYISSLIAISSSINIRFIISFRLPIKRLTCTSCTRANFSFFNLSIIRRTTSCYWH